MSDLTLKQDILDELSLDPQLDSAHIGVAVDRGVVTLTGHVSNCAEKLAADEAVRRIRGVRAVAEEIDARIPGLKKMAEDENATRATAILTWDSVIPQDNIQITVNKGWVYLEGAVDWQYQRTAAQDRLSKLSGLVGVVNNITTKNQPHLADIRRHVEGAFPP